MTALRAVSAGPLRVARRPKRPASCAEELLELRAETLGAAAVRELLGLLELRAQVVEPGPVGAAGVLVRRVVERRAQAAPTVSPSSCSGPPFRAARSRRTAARGARAPGAASSVAR